MMADAKAWLFAPGGLKDGPMPAHYEPAESAVLKTRMSMGIWLLTVYVPMVGLAGAAELAPGWLGRLLAPLARPAGLAAALTAPAVASYTAVLLADTATPTSHEAYRELPFVFGSAAAASGGPRMPAIPVAESGPTQRLAIGGALLELGMERRMERSMGLAAEALHEGKPGQLLRAAERLIALGAVTALGARRSRALGVLSGAVPLAGSACSRCAIFEAGQESARDPGYTVVAQRERLNARLG